MVTKLSSIFLSAFIFLLFSNLAIGEPSDEERLKTICKDKPFLCKEKARFSAYQPNYAIYQATEDDDNSIEVHYSFKYLLTRPDCISEYRYKNKSASDALTCINAYKQRSEWYFSYTGEFDFYMGTRDSGPVINRISNPAFHRRQYLGNRYIWDRASISWFDIGIEHRSDGQVIDVDDKVNDPSSVNNGRFKTQVELENGNREYFDALSRGANYISLEAKMNIGDAHKLKKECDKTITCFEFWASVKPIYLTHDSNITWGPLANSNVKISDYDRFKFIIADTFNTGWSLIPKIELGGEWVLGDELLKTDSQDISVFLPLRIKDGWKIPLYIRAHFGPLSTLSDYTKEQNSIGIGLKFR